MFEDRPYPTDFIKAVLEFPSCVESSVYYRLGLAKRSALQ